MNTPEYWQVTTTHRKYSEVAYTKHRTPYTMGTESTAFAIAPLVGHRDPLAPTHDGIPSRRGTLHVVLQRANPDGSRLIILDRTVDAWDRDEERKLRLEVRDLVEANAHHGDLIHITTAVNVYITTANSGEVPAHIVQGYKRNLKIS